MRRFMMGMLGAALLLPCAAQAETTIGLIGPMTGQYAVFGEQFKRGAEQAAKDIGGIKLRVADDACDPKQAVAVANQMASEGVQYVVGHYCSGSAIPASKVFMENGMLLVSPAATNPKLTDEAQTYVFRVCGRDDRQGKVIGDYLLAHHKQDKIALLNDKSAYGRGLADEVKRVINAGGAQEVMFESYTAGERDYRALIAKLKQAGVKVAFIGGYHTEAALIARQLAEAGAKIRLFGGDALVTDEFWSIAGAAGEGTMMTFGPDPRGNPSAQAVVDGFRKTGYEPEGYTLYTYAAFQVLAKALGAGQATPEKVAAQLRAGKTETVIGTLGFDAKGDVEGAGYVLYRWHDGKYAEIDAVQTSRWIGTIRLGKEESRLRFDIEDNHGTLSGTSWFADPETGAWVQQATLSGNRLGDKISFTTTADIKVQGVVTGDSIEGTLEFSREPDESKDVTATLHLSIEKPIKE